jgi:hypothetical protein
MVERITASMDGLATTVAADKAESSSGVEHTTSKKKKGLKKDAMSMLALKLQGRKDTADLRQNSVQQQVETNHGHLIGPEHSSSHGAASPMQDETSHAEGAIAQPSHGPYWTEGQPIIPDELVYLTPHQQSCYENECAIRESLNQPMPPRYIFLRKDEYEPVPDITNEPDSEDESNKRDENGRTAKGRGKMRATDGKVPLSKSKASLVFHPRVGSKIRSVAYWLCRPLLRRATGQPVASSLPNVAPGGGPDESCSVEIGLDRLAAAYEDVGASQDYARRASLGSMVVGWGWGCGCGC